MNGKLLAFLIVGPALIAGLLMYWLQVYAFYDRLDPAAVDLTLVTTAGAVSPFPGEVSAAIDAGSSPLRFRACAQTDASRAELDAAYVRVAEPVPLTAPGWFDCFDAEVIGAALEDGRATGYLSQADVHEGVDRVIAVFDDGRAFAWHQLNEKLKD